VKSVVGFTGTREGMTEAQKAKVRELVIASCTSEVHHGGCIGADVDFDFICHNIPGRAIKVVVHPSSLKSYHGTVLQPCELRADYPPLERNRHIVSESGILVATPKGVQEQIRSGTWTTVRYARNQGRTVLIVFPDGQLKIKGPIYWSSYR
jgi:hypothetical protein